jgi:hypothetical protein
MGFPKIIGHLSPDRKTLAKVRHPILTAKLVIAAHMERHTMRRNRQKPHRWTDATSNGSE